MSLDNTIANNQLTCNGSEQQLSIPGGVRSVAIKAFAANVGIVYLGVTGDSGSTEGYPLDPGESITMDLLNPNKLFVTGAVGDKVAWITTSA